MSRTNTILALFSACLAACSTDTFTGDDGGDPGDGGQKDALVIVPDGGGADAAASDGDAGESKDVGPEAEAGPAFKRVFISSTKTQSNFGGLAAGDAICQTAANGAGLGGTWKAWLSTTTTSAASRLTHANVPYQLVDGTQVASSWNALVSGAPLKNAINLDEHGNYVTFNDGSELGYTWTGTATDGSTSTETCLDWTFSDNNCSAIHFGTVGTDGYVDSRWTARGAPACCTVQVFALFCFEQ
ncbi:MAG TPA: hypothetical protein VFA98_08685 [Thermoanaerobaculia bacterium]|jgi:hypothetical protein|nr:hypothetical protein [Thermoanaerobaculia bacterium]